MSYPVGRLEDLSVALNSAKNLIVDAVQARRLERAAEQAIYHPKTFYHGTAAKPTTTMPDGNIFDEFKLWEGEDPTRSTVRSEVSKLGVSLGGTPETAEVFGRLASPNGHTGVTIMPVRFRANRVGHFDLDGSELNSDIFGQVQDAWKDGFDAIEMRNYTTPDGKKDSFFLIKNPNQIRSVNAKFAPEKRNSANLRGNADPRLLAGVAGAVALGMAASQDSDAREPNFVTRYKNEGLFPVVNNPDGSFSTHRMAAEIGPDGKAYAFPTIMQKPDGELLQFDDNYQALDYGLKSGEVLEFPSIDEAVAYAEGGYKKDAWFGREAINAAPNSDSPDYQMPAYEGPAGSLYDAPESFTAGATGAAMAAPSMLDSAIAMAGNGTGFVFDSLELPMRYAHGLAAAAGVLAEGGTWENALLRGSKVSMAYGVRPYISHSAEGAE